MSDDNPWSLPSTPFSEDFPMFMGGDQLEDLDSFVTHNFDPRLLPGSFSAAPAPTTAAAAATATTQTPAVIPKKSTRARVLAISYSLVSSPPASPRQGPVVLVVVPKQFWNPRTTKGQASPDGVAVSMVIGNPHDQISFFDHASTIIRDLSCPPPGSEAAWFSPQLLNLESWDQWFEIWLRVRGNEELWRQHCKTVQDPCQIFAAVVRWKASGSGSRKQRVSSDLIHPKYPVVLFLPNFSTPAGTIGYSWVMPCTLIACQFHAGGPSNTSLKRSSSSNSTSPVEGTPPQTRQKVDDLRSMSSSTSCTSSSPDGTPPQPPQPPGPVIVPAPVVVPPTRFWTVPPIITEAFLKAKAMPPAKPRVFVAFPDIWIVSHWALFRLSSCDLTTFASGRLFSSDGAEDRFKSDVLVERNGEGNLTLTVEPQNKNWLVVIILNDDYQWPDNIEVSIGSALDARGNAILLYTKNATQITFIKQFSKLSLFGSVDQKQIPDETIGDIPSFNHSGDPEAQLELANKFALFRKQGLLNKVKCCELGTFFTNLGRRFDGDGKFVRAEACFFEAAMCSSRAHGLTSPAHAPALSDWALSLLNAGCVTSDFAIRLLLLALRIAQNGDAEEDCGCTGGEDVAWDISREVRAIASRPRSSRPATRQQSDDGTDSDACNIHICIAAIEIPGIHISKVTASLAELYDETFKTPPFFWKTQVTVTNPLFELKVFGEDDQTVAGSLSIRIGRFLDEDRPPFWKALLLSDSTAVGTDSTVVGTVVVKAERRSRDWREKERFPRTDVAPVGWRPVYVTPIFPVSASPKAVMEETPSAVARGYVNREEQPRKLTQLNAPGPTRNFNSTFQQVIEALRTAKSPEEAVKAQQELVKLNKSFVDLAVKYGKVIIAEKSLRQGEKKTIKPVPGLTGVAGGTKFVVGDSLIFKFADDDKRLYGGDEEVAAKVAGHELKSLGALINTEAPFSFPLMCLIEFKGVRLVAESLLPINGAQSLVMGTLNANEGQRPINKLAKRSPEVLRQLREMFAAVSIRPYVTGDGVEVLSACDVETHVGSDGKIYILDLSRVFPPQAPQPVEGRPAASHLYQLLRPELISWYSHRSLQFTSGDRKMFCSDGYSEFLAKFGAESREATTTISDATERLFDTVIPAFAGELVGIVAQLTESKSGKSKAKKGRDLKHFNIKTALHNRGINMRHMTLVHEHLGDADRPGLVPVVQNARALLMIEMAVRSISSILNQKMRDEPDRLDLHHEMLANITSRSSGYFWTEVSRKMTAKYGFDLGTPQEAFEKITRFHAGTFEGDVDGAYGKWIFLRRLIDLTGCRLDGRFLRDLRSDLKRFDAKLATIDLVDVEDADVKVKSLNLAYLAAGCVFRLRETPGDTEDRIYALKRARRALEDALSATPHSPKTLCTLASVELALHQAQHPEAKEKPTLALLADPVIFGVYEKLLMASQVDPCLDSRFELAKFLSQQLGHDDGAAEILMESKVLSHEALEFLKEILGSSREPKWVGSFLSSSVHAKISDWVSDRLKSLGASSATVIAPLKP